MSLVKRIQVSEKWRKLMLAWSVSGDVGSASEKLMTRRGDDVGAQKEVHRERHLQVSSWLVLNSILTHCQGSSRSILAYCPRERCLYSASPRTSIVYTWACINSTILYTRSQANAIQLQDLLLLFIFIVPSNFFDHFNFVNIDAVCCGFHAFYNCTLYNYTIVISAINKRCNDKTRMDNL